jgi:hypothetical protein
MEKVKLLLLKAKAENLHATIDLRKQIVEQLKERLALEKALNAI